MKTKLTTLTLAIIGVFGGVAHAQDAALPVVTDTDGNGSYSLSEVQAIYPELSGEAFVELDTDGSGELSADELKLAQESGKLTLQ